MGDLFDIFSEYTRMRSNGLDSKAALKALRAYIEPLSSEDKESLAQHVRAWEAGERQPPGVSPFVTDQPADARSAGIKPLKASAIRSIAPGKAEDAVGWMTCPNCGKKNRQNEVFCYSCGHLLEPAAGEFDTRRFADADEGRFSPDHFSPDSILLLRIRSTGEYFELRPQRHVQELIIGRSSGNSAMRPDIDLAEYQAAEMGVSRLHLALKYEAADNAIHLHDLGSANGSFVNGQKFHPKEVRVLRHGDEIRLGKFILRVYFRHPGDEIR